LRFVFLMLLLPISAAAPSGRIGVLFLGEVAPSTQLFLDWLDAEPRFSFTPVPCDLQWVTFKEAKRFSRMYLPRTQERLSEDYDAVIFEDFTPDVLTLTFVNWTQTAVSRGMGIALIEFAYWGGSNEITKWMAMDFYDVFPADVYMNIIPAVAGRTHYRVRNDKGPLNLPGIESVPMNQGYHGDLGPRPGSVVEATWRGRGSPALVTSTYGEGHTLQLDHGWDNIPGDTRLKYKYLQDYIFNQVFCIAGVPYPEDLDLVHVTRASLAAYAQRKKATLSVIEFVEKFGANPSGVGKILENLDSRYARATGLYLSGNYDEAGDELLRLLDEFSKVDSELMAAKDRAFFWIYIVEWTSVLGVGTLCAVLLWSLMVRRSLYRSITTTRSYAD